MNGDTDIAKPLAARYLEDKDRKREGRRLGQYGGAYRLSGLSLRAWLYALGITEAVHDSYMRFEVVADETICRRAMRISSATKRHVTRMRSETDAEKRAKITKIAH